MAQPYLISKAFDPLFALTIGLTAAIVRIRREERERWHLAHPLHTSPSTSPSSSTSTSAPSSNPTDSPHDTSASTAAMPTESMNNMGGSNPRKAHASQTAIERRLRTLEHEPTLNDTYTALVDRVQKVDLRGWQWGDLWKRGGEWGIVEPNR